MQISAERTLILPEYIGTTPGLQWPLVWPAKDPQDAGMDFSLDVSGWLTEIQDTIAAFTVGSAPTGGTSDLVINSAFSHNGVCTVLVSAGNPFVEYTVSFLITSAINGETLSRSITLPVEPRYGNMVAETTVSGVVQ